ncbi:kynureninase [Idiomarina seosinensis]|uniref:kynureninase n=1 Tax=Idiomarina seosinensis TaxID=281739 RepID=UPI00384AB5BD
MTRNEVIQRDDNDPLASYRTEFDLPDNTIYLDGNSLGAIPHRVKKRVAETVEQQWGNDLITSWNKHQWVNLPEIVGEKIAPIIGAGKGQVICCDSISVNLFKLLSAALSYNGSPERRFILSTEDNFPTDGYIAQGLQELLGAGQCQFKAVDEEQLSAAIDQQVAVVLVTEVNFRSGRRLDINKLTQRAHQNGALIVVDLAHSAGVMPVDLDAWQVDMAVGCTYKYLNGGPGAPAFLYLNRKWHSKIKQPVAGWFGHRSPFDFNPDYQASSGVKQFLAGTPSILSMAAVDSALELFAEIDMQQVRLKSQQLTSLFQQLAEQYQLTRHLSLLSPLLAEARGSQLSYAHDQAYGICQALIKRGVVADFRAPCYIRFGFAPLYNSYTDVYDAVAQLRHVIEQQEHLQKRWQQRQAVT